MTQLVLAEHDQDHLRSATLATVTAALILGPDVHVLVAGKNCDGAAREAAAIQGVTAVIRCDDGAYEHPLPEALAPLIVSIAREYSHILAPATTMGKNVLPRAAAMLDVAQISDICAIVDGNTFVRPIHAGSALAHVQSSDSLKIITVRPTAFDPAPATGGQATVTPLAFVPGSGGSWWEGLEVETSGRPELSNARIVVSGGRGLGSKSQFALIEDLADTLAAAVGASRAAVDGGFVANSAQVGQTGAIVAPDLYIAVGISGAIQHLAGMKDSKVIVAINKDEEAPIFQVADYGLVGDLFTLVPELTQALKRERRSGGG